MRAEASPSEAQAGDKVSSVDMGAASWQLLAACSAVVALALGLYWPAAGAWFFQDDLQWLAGTMRVDRGLFTVSIEQHFFRPVIALYFWIATHLFDGSPVRFHWANHVLHAINGVLVLLLAGETGIKPRFAFFSALVFVSMPAYVEAIAWISALAEPVTTCFGILSVYGLLVSRRQNSRRWRTVSVVCFTLALMTHESAAVLLPLLLLADWAFGAAVAPPAPPWRDPVPRIRRLAPYGVLLGIYLLVGLAANRDNYLVEEGHYRLGFHAIQNTLGYVVTLYAGKRNLASFVAVGVVLTVLLVRGTPRVVFAAAWILLTILPFAFFTWSTTSRYAYTPAVGMALLLAVGLAWLDDRLARILAPRVRQAIVLLLGAFIIVRFAVFASENIRNFAERSEPFRQLALTLRERPPVRPPGAHVEVDGRTVDALQLRYVEALVQWEFRDLTLRVVVTR